MSIIPEGFTGVAELPAGYGMKLEWRYFFKGRPVSRERYIDEIVRSVARRRADGFKWRRAAAKLSDQIAVAASATTEIYATCEEVHADRIDEGLDAYREITDKFRKPDW